MVQQIIHLSEKALAEKDRDGFLGWLIKRDGLVSQLIGKDIHAEVHALKDWLDMESHILARLKKERAQVLREADEVSRGKKAVRRYSLGCVVPPGPIYCDKRE